MSVHEHLDLLGMKVQDNVTGLKGVVTGVSFDLYGCIQAIVHPGMEDGGGKLLESFWFDINRLKVINSKPVMQQPDFITGPVAQGRKGPAEKPRLNKA